MYLPRTRDLIGDPSDACWRSGSVKRLETRTTCKWCRLITSCCVKRQAGRPRDLKQCRTVCRSRRMGDAENLSSFCLALPSTLLAQGSKRQLGGFRLSMDYRPSPDGHKSRGKMHPIQGHWTSKSRMKTIRLLPSRNVDPGPKLVHHLSPLAVGRTSASSRRAGTAWLLRRRGQWMCNRARQETGHPWPISVLRTARRASAVLTRVADSFPNVG